jgi:hypothetical protein
MRRIRSAVVAFVTLWLPLQGFAAVAMPFCTHAVHVIAAPVDSQASEHDHRDHTHGAAHGAGWLDSDARLTCNDCGACHLACAPMLSGSVWLGADAASFDFRSLPTQSPRVFTPDQPNPPPLA